MRPIRTPDIVDRAPMETHFGLGKMSAESYRVEVFYPATKKLAVRKNVKPGQRIVVKEE